jgi:hypothetical protein
MHRIANFGLLLGAALGCAAAMAQAVVRCGNAYGEQACVGGTVVPVDDVRTQAQRAQAAAAITRDARMAQALEASRLKAESDARPGPYPALLRNKPSDPDRQPEAGAGKPRPAHFSAVAPRQSGDATRATKPRRKAGQDSEQKKGKKKEARAAAKATKAGRGNTSLQR